MTGVQTCALPIFLNCFFGSWRTWGGKQFQTLAPKRVVELRCYSRLLTCNSLFITYYIFLPCSCFRSLRDEKYLHRRHSQILKRPFRGQNCKAILPAKFDARRQASAKIKRATGLVQPLCYNLFDWTIQTVK